MSVLLRTMMERMASRLLYEGIITSGDLHIATKDGEAMFFHDSIDFSAYAGNDAGLTPYRFVFIDSAGKIAIAYGGAAGGGEALGSEILDDPDFSGDGSSWVLDGTAWTYDAVNNEFDAIAANVTDKFYQNITPDQYGLYKSSITCSAYTAGNCRQQFGVNLAGAWITGVMTDVLYVNNNSGGSFAYQVYGRSILFTGAIASVSVKKVTDVPATGLHLMSTKNGTTRNMASVETGFNPNAIVGVKIYG